MKKNVLRSLSAMFMIAALTVAIGCSDEDKKEEAPTLYTRLGGVDAISAVVDDFIAEVVDDEVINEKFAATVADEYRTALLRANLIDQICAGAGGPCAYKGKSMKDAHQGMGISEAEFTALVGDLIAALDANSVPMTEKNELLGILGPMKSDIVED